MKNGKENSTLFGIWFDFFIRYVIVIYINQRGEYDKHSVLCFTGREQQLSGTLEVIQDITDVRKLEGRRDFFIKYDTIR